MLTEILLGGLLLCQLLLLLSGLMLVKKLKSFLSENVLSFFTPKGKDEQSQFADTLDNIASRLAHAIIASAKGWLMAQNSAAVRQENAAARQELMANAPPALGGLMAFAPGLAKKIVKHPELAQLAMQFMGNMGGGREREAQASNNGGNHSSSNPFKI